jgi:hypothetical protein
LPTDATIATSTVNATRPHMHGESVVRQIKNTKRASNRFSVRSRAKSEKSC